MAGDWIKMRVNLVTDPAVKAMARELKIDAYSLVGRLHVFWSWADEHTTNGEIPWVTFEDIDDVAGKRGFAAQLLAVGWLEKLENAVCLPNFERHNGDSAKRRAMEMEKKRRQRQGDKPPASGPATVPTPSGQTGDNIGTRGEESRGEKSNTLGAPASAAAVVAEVDCPFPPETGKKVRERNPLIDALAACGGADPLQVTPRAWGSIAAILADIRAVCPDLTPAEIQRRSANYRTHMRSDTVLTPAALAKNWALCDKPAENQQPVKGRALFA